MTRTDYRSMRIQAPVVASFRQLVRQLSAEADRDLTQSEALAALLALGLDDVRAVAERLPFKLRSASGLRVYAADPADQLGEAPAGAAEAVQPSDSAPASSGRESETDHATE